MKAPLTSHPNKLRAANVVAAVCLAAIGMGACATGIYIGQIDDAPGAGVLGIVLMVGSLAYAVRVVRSRT